MAPGFVQTAEGKHHVEELIDEDIVNVNADYISECQFKNAS